MALRDSILQMAGRLAEEEAHLPTPEGPAKVILRELTAGEAQAFETAVRNKAQNLLGFLIQMTVRDPETHELVFQPADRGAIEELGMTALKPLATIITRMSGLSEAEVEKAKQDLQTTPGADGSSS